MKILFAATLGLLISVSAYAQSTRTFQNYMSTLPSATTPLGGTEPTIVLQGGIVKQTPSAQLGVGSSPVTNVTSNSFGTWTCNSQDQSTTAQAIINGVANTGGGTLYFPPCPVATFTGALSGTQLTVTSIGTGQSIVLGSLVWGEGILPNTAGTNAQRVVARTRITAQVSGTIGGNGVYTISQSGNSSGGVMLSQPCYRADSQLSVPLYPTSASQQFSGGPSSSPMRFTGAGASSSLVNGDIGANANGAATCLDVRDQSHLQMSGVGFTVDGGTGYNSGTGVQTLTLSGGSGPIATFGAITGGSGGTPGTYLAVWLVCKTGQPCHGFGAKATVVVGGGGNVTSVSCGSTCGGGFLANDVLTISTLTGPAGVPSNFSVPVATVTSTFNCPTAPTWKVVVSGGVVQGGAQPSIGYASNSSSIGQTTPGNCTIVPQNPVTVTSTDGGTGATFDIYWTGGKLYFPGGGATEIDHLYIADAGSSNSEAMVYATNALLNIHDNVFGCSGDQNQDAIVMGGLLGSGHIVPPNNTADSSALGFGSIVSRNVFDGCNRIVFSRTFNTSTTVTNNIANGMCSGDRFMEFMSAQFTNLYPYVANNYSEACQNFFRYGIVLNTVQGGFFANNQTVDIQGTPTYQYDYFFQDASGGSANNEFILSYGCSVVITQLPFCSTFSPGGTSLTSPSLIGPVVGMFSPNLFGNQGGSFAGFFQGEVVTGVYNASNCPQGVLNVTGANNNNWLVMGNDNANGETVIDTNASNCSGSGLPLRLNKSGAQVRFGGPLVTQTVSFSQLTAATGAIAYVKDGLAGACGDGACTTFGTTVTGGSGALHILVWYNGTNWTLVGK